MAAIIWDNIPDTYDPDASQEIAAIDGRIPAKLTRIGPDSNSPHEMIYLDEVPATFGVVDHRVSFQMGTVERSERWYRVEVQVPATEGRVHKDMRLVLARGRSVGWSEVVPFKTPNKKGPWEGQNPLTEPVASVQELQTRLENLSFDFWEKGDYLTAGSSIPPEPQLPADRNYSRGPWVLGVCDNFGECRASLWKHSHMCKLLELTEAGNLSFWPNDAPVRLRVLHDAAREDGSLFMEIAIRQAIAGPDKDCDSWIGRPAVKLVEQVYCDFIYNANRSAIENDSREREHIDRLRTQYGQFLRERGQRPRSKPAS